MNGKRILVTPYTTKMKYLLKELLKVLAMLVYAFGVVIVFLLISDEGTALLIGMVLALVGVFIMDAFWPSNR